MATTIQDDEIRRALQRAGLRVTSIRIRVYKLLAASRNPMSHRECVDALPGLDRVSVFRNLISLVHGGLARRLELGDHTWRFELIQRDGATEGAHHAHFTCNECGEVTCLDDVQIHLGPKADARYASAIVDADLRISGVCPICR